MIIIKKLYNLYRNTRSKYLLILNKLIYGKSFFLGKKVYVRKGFVVTIEGEGKVRIGKGVFFNNNCSLNSLCEIDIGDNCIFGENVHIYDHNHIYYDKNIPINLQGFTQKKVSIGDNCWIGSNVSILKGVQIGRHCVIGAGCTIYHDIPDDSVIVSGQNAFQLSEKK